MSDWHGEDLDLVLKDRNILASCIVEIDGWLKLFPESVEPETFDQFQLIFTTLHNRRKAAGIYDHGWTDEDIGITLIDGT